MIDMDGEQRKQLVTTIEQVTPLSSHVRQAFLSVSRRLFVPQYYKQEGNVLNWTLDETGEMAYTDEALVTKFDPISKHPSSSSSQPSLMAAKLEALDLRPGQRVLEIGAGTGYNAALIAQMVGPTGCVVSIDIDDELVQVATQHLADAGFEEVCVVCGDGLQGYADAAPYDRMLATGSFRVFPQTWLDQLAPDGILVGNLVGNLASVFVCLKKELTTADGLLLPLSGDKRYMELHHGAFPRPQAFNWSEYTTATPREQVIEIDIPTLIQNTDFLFLLQCMFPLLQRHWHYDHSSGMLDMYLVAEKTCLRVRAQTATTWVVQERGDAPLWEHLYEAYRAWERDQHPSLDQYHVHIKRTGQSISLHERQWSLTP